MPSYICTVTSTEEEQHEQAINEHGHTRTVETSTIRSRFPKEDLRPWGHKLYGFLCVFYLPLLVDLIWCLYYSDALAIYANNKGQPAPGRAPSPFHFLVWILPCFIWPVFAKGSFSLAMTLIYSAFALVWNLFVLVTPFALLDLLGVSYFKNMNVRIWKSTRKYDKEGDMMELALELPGETPCGFETLIIRPVKGDKIKVCFGPFEYWCLFRAQTQSDAPAMRSLPV